MIAGELPLYQYKGEIKYWMMNNKQYNKYVFVCETSETSKQIKLHTINNQHTINITDNVSSGCVI